MGFGLNNRLGVGLQRWFGSPSRKMLQDIRFSQETGLPSCVGIAGEAGLQPELNDVPVYSPSVLDALDFADLTGVTIVSYSGDAVPNIVGNQIQFTTAGTFYNATLSDGTFLRLQNFGGDRAWSSTNTNHATLTGSGSWWTRIDNVSSLNQALGFKLITLTDTTEVYIENNIPDADIEAYYPNWESTVLLLQDGRSLLADGSTLDLHPTINSTTLYKTQKIINSEFDDNTGWTRGLGVTIHDGSLWFDGVYTGVVTDTITSETLTIGKTYLISFYVAQKGTNIRIVDGATNPYFYNTGLISYTYTATQTSVKIRVSSSVVTQIDYFRAEEITAISEYIDTLDEVGAEIASNWDFSLGNNGDWTLGGGWSISGGKAIQSGVNYSQLTQVSKTTVGKTYLFEVVCSSYTSGTLRVYTGSGTDQKLYITAEGIFSKYITAQGTSIFCYSVDSFIGILDSISVKEVTNGSSSISLNTYQAGQLLPAPYKATIITDQSTKGIKLPKP